MTRIGATMRAVADYVSGCPGKSKAEGLRGVGLAHRGLRAYRPINRTIAAGLVICEKGSPTRCRLFSAETARELDYLREALLHGEPTPQRSAEILAEVDKIRAAQAAKFAKEASL